MDDIEKSFGGRSIDDYSDQQVNSSNAYMLMYRQIDQRRNTNAMSQEEFPPHIKDLHNILQKKFALTKKWKEKELSMFSVLVHLTDCDIKTSVNCKKNTTIRELKSKAMEVLLNSNLYLLNNNR